jgi:hypothetical protein
MSISKTIVEFNNGEQITMFTSGSVMFTHEEELSIQEKIRNERKRVGLYIDGQIPNSEEKLCPICGSINPKLFCICKNCYSHIY